MDIICNSCGGKVHQKIMMIQGHCLMRCNTCSLGFLDPIPTDEQISAMYQEEYYQSKDSNQVGYSNYKEDVDLIIKTVIRRYARMKDFLPKKQPLKLLDVGCAYGYYLDIARLYGWDVLGVEINPAAVKDCEQVSKLSVIQKPLTKANFPDAHFDVVTAWDLVEHVQDPNQLFKEISRILKPGGSFALATPDVDSFPSKLMGNRWMGYKSKEHIYFFSKKTLTDYCERHGMKVMESYYVGKYISRDLFINRVNNYFGSFAAGLFGAIVPRSFYLNPFDIVYLRAQKI